MGSPVDGVQKATLREWIAVLGAVIGFTMAFLDLSITNASLRDIQGTLGASIDEGGWISTSYLIAEIIVIPLTPWLANIFSPRRYILFNTVLFIIFSVMCGLTTTLPEMIVARFVQGLAGGALVPFASSTVVTLLPASQRNVGMVILALSGSVAPMLGPTIGGWITDNYGWQLSFTMNLVPGLIMFAMIYFSFEPKPTNLHKLRDGNWLAILTVMIGLSTLTYVLEEGQRLDWLGDETIRNCSMVSVASIVMFLWIELRSQKPLVNLRLLGRRNFAIAIFANELNGFILYGTVFLLPMYLGTVQKYDASQIGTTTMWMGLPQLALAPFIPGLMKRVDSRLLLLFGLTMFGFSSGLNGFLSYDSARDQLRLAIVLRGIGQGLVATPLRSLAFEGIAKEEVPSASAISSMMRNLGGSIGIGILGTVLVRRYQFHFARITERISPLDISIRHTHRALSSLAEVLPGRRSGISLLMLGKVINREARIMAFSDCFLLLTCAAAVMILGTSLMRAPASENSPNRKH